MTQGEWVSLSDNPWDEIVYNLWQGGMYYGPHMTPCVPHKDDFDLVVNMAGRGDSRATLVSEEVSQINFYIEDDKLGPIELGFVKEAVATVVHRLHRGRKVLVRCQAGWNRSGLVVAKALLDMDHGSPDQVIDLIRAKRGANALSNPHFVRYIEDHVKS